MAKYIIDIPDEKTYLYVNNEYTFLRMPISVGENENKSISAPTFLRIKPYTEPDEDEVWEFAKKLISMSGNEVSDMMGCMTNFGEIMYNVPYQEAKAKYEAWKKQKDEIRVGDEVKENTELWTGVVVGFDKFDDLIIMDRSGNSCCGYKAKFFRKTGRHFPEVTELLKNMRGES